MSDPEAQQPFMPQVTFPNLGEVFAQAAEQLALSQARFRETRYYTVVVSLEDATYSVHDSPSLEAMGEFIKTLSGQPVCVVPFDGVRLGITARPFPFLVHPVTGAKVALIAGDAKDAFSDGYMGPPREVTALVEDPDEEYEDEDDEEGEEEGETDDEPPQD